MAGLGFAACVLHCDLMLGYIGSAGRDTQCMDSSATHIASSPHFLQDKMVSFKEKGSYFQCMSLWLG